MRFCVIIMLSLPKDQCAFIRVRAVKLQHVQFNCSGRQFISYGPGDCYLLDPEQFHFSENDIPRLGEGKYIGIGASKGMHVIEGHQKLSACAFIDGTFQ